MDGSDDGSSGTGRGSGRSWRDHAATISRQTIKKEAVKIMNRTEHKTEPNRTETVFPLYRGKHVSGCGWGNGTEKTDLNRLKRTLNRLDEPVDDFSKTAFNTLLTAFLILTKNPVRFPVNI